jgi:hypothetical protein
MSATLIDSLMGDHGIILNKPANPDIIRLADSKVIDNNKTGPTNMMADDKTVVDFNSAKQPHTVNRAEDKVKAIRNAFKVSREEASPKKGKSKSKNTKTKKRTRKK